jgi:hypothetical protein
VTRRGLDIFHAASGADPLPVAAGLLVSILLFHEQSGRNPVAPHQFLPVLGNIFPRKWEYLREACQKNPT